MIQFGSDKYVTNNLDSPFNISNLILAENTRRKKKAERHKKRYK